MDENKANLTQFISIELERHVIQYGLEIVISGGFDDAEKWQRQLGLMFPTYGLHMKKQIPAYCYMLLMPKSKGMRSSSFSAETQM